MRRSHLRVASGRQFRFVMNDAGQRTDRYDPDPDWVKKLGRSSRVAPSECQALLQVPCSERCQQRWS